MKCKWIDFDNLLHTLMVLSLYEVMVVLEHIDGDINVNQQF